MTGPRPSPGLATADAGLLAAANTARRTGRRDAAAESALAERHGCDERLAAYGTLRPGEPNHGELAACPGVWRPGTVTGHLVQRDYPEFTFAADGTEVPVMVLHSRELPRHWAHLDAFEGPGYVRILVPVRLAAGDVVIANLYATARGAG